MSSCFIDYYDKVKLTCHKAYGMCPFECPYLLAENKCEKIKKIMDDVFTDLDVVDEDNVRFIVEWISSIANTLDYDWDKVADLVYCTKSLVEECNND